MAETMGDAKDTAGDGSATEEKRILIVDDDAEIVESLRFASVFSLLSVMF